MNNNFELFKNLTKEEINNNLEWGDPYEFGTQYAKYLLNEKQELIDYLKEQINQCKLIGNDEDYIKLDVYNEILSKIEKSDK